MRSVATEERRIKRLIGALLATLAPLAVAEACGTDGGASGTDGGADATLDHLGDDVATSSEAATDAAATNDATPGFDANCTSTVTAHDAGLDADNDAYADPYCTYELSCGIMGVLRTSGCQVLSVTELDAQPQPLGCWVVADGCGADVFVPDANVSVRCAECIGGGGRRPAGLQATRVARARRSGGAHLRADSLSIMTGRYFAAMAFEERAAVLAFARMEKELPLHGAPAGLVRAARRATRDERRHARVFGTLARRHGADVLRARLGGPARRELVDIAVENAAEGCVRETFGAALLSYQASHASDVALRHALGKIAADEARHAALSLGLAGWVETQLTTDENARVRSARSGALDALRGEIARRERSAHDAVIGHPTREVATKLLLGLTRELGHES